MAFVVEPATAADFEVFKTLYGPDDGGLASPLVRECWPVMPGDIDSVRRRVDWSLQRQLDMLESDPSLLFIKATDPLTGEVTSLSTWQYVSKATPVKTGEVAAGGPPTDPKPAPIWPEGLDSGFLKAIATTMGNQRGEWMGNGRHWILNMIVTREPFRRRGASSRILGWGLQQARKDGVPVFLEADLSAARLYGKHGFREVGRQVTEFEDRRYEAVRMRFDP